MTVRAAVARSRLVSDVTHHRPLTFVSMICAVATIGVGAAYFLDTREILGVPVWEKPLKFLISTAVYGLTFSWFSSLVSRGRKAVWWLGTVMATALVVELIIIVGLAAAGRTSHFNVSTPFHLAMWSVMATAIATLWVVAFLVGVFLWNSRRIEPLLRSGIRWGLAIGLAGMGLAFTMTPPQSQQIEDWNGVAGAHTVGALDGGPGIPFLGWSTVAGDLRIAHFIGLHALQVFPLLAVLLSSRAIGFAAHNAILHATGVAYSLIVLVTYFQALMGQSVVAPSQEIIALASLSGLAGAGIGLWIFRRLRRNAPTLDVPAQES